MFHRTLFLCNSKGLYDSTLSYFTSSAYKLKKVSQKQDNVLKKYNKENKLLYGALLETQAQRKKRLIKKGIVSNEGIDTLEKRSDSEAIEFDKNLISYGQIQDKLSDALSKHFPFENSTKPLLVTTDDAPSQHLFVENNKDQSNTEGYYPSVTSILSATMSPFSRKALERWRKNKIASLGMDGFLALNKATLQKGKEFHLAIHHALLGKQDLNVSVDIVNCIKSAKNILNQISKVHVIEGEVVHKKLKYRGFVDCICDIGNVPNVAIEWKKSENKKSELEQTYDAPLQLVAYMGAANYDESFNYQIHTGAVVVVNEDGSPASVFFVKDDALSDYWTLWYKRYQLFCQEEYKQEVIL